MKTLIIALLLLLMPLCASAVEHRIDLSFGIPNSTYHYEDCGDCNENNRLIAAAYSYKFIGVSGGYFLNSYYNDAGFFGVHFNIPLGEVMEIRPIVGGVYGYTSEQLLGVPCTSTDICLSAGVTVSLWAFNRVSVQRLYFGNQVRTDAIQVKALEW